MLCVSDRCFLRSFVLCIIRRGSATGHFEFGYKRKFTERLIQGSVAQVLWLRIRLGKQKKKIEPCNRVSLPPAEMLGSSRKTSRLTEVIRTFELHFLSL